MGDNAGWRLGRDLPSGAGGHLAARGAPELQPDRPPTTHGTLRSNNPGPPFQDGVSARNPVNKSKGRRAQVARILSRSRVAARSQSLTAGTSKAAELGRRTFPPQRPPTRPRTGDSARLARSSTPSPGLRSCVVPTSPRHALGTRITASGTGRGSRRQPLPPNRTLPRSRCWS